ncbi:MAG TPA: DUF1989 domain-containing protein [Methylomirabilota bacterium]
MDRSPTSSPTTPPISPRRSAPSTPSWRSGGSSPPPATRYGPIAGARWWRSCATTPGGTTCSSPCDPWRYEYDFGVTGHRSCSDNFLEVLREWRIERHQLPHPVNFFQNMRYPDGRVEFDRSLARPGDAVELRALMDLVAAVSACPMDLNPISNFQTHDVTIEVL